MAKPNYRQAKKNKELARKARQEEKMRRRSARTLGTSEDGEQDAGVASEQSGPPVHPETSS